MLKNQVKCRCNYIEKRTYCSLDFIVNPGVSFKKQGYKLKRHE